MENQLTSYYTPAAIERLEIDFQDKINQFQKDNEIDKQQILTNAKNILNKEFEHEDKALVNIFQQNLKEQYVSIDKKFDEELKNYDIEITNLITNISTDEELTLKIDPENYENNDDYEKKKRDVIRNHKTQIRKQNQNNRIHRRLLQKNKVEL